MGTAMRPAYTIDLEHGCIFLKWSGAMTAHGVIDFNRDLVQDPDYRLGLNRLIDLRRADFGATSGEVEEMGGAIIGSRDASEGHRKWAFLVGRDLEYGFLRMLGTMTDQARTIVRPFRKLDEAMAWLGLPATLGDPFETISN